MVDRQDMTLRQAVVRDAERARRFYEAAGWWLEDGKARIEHLPGFDLNEVRYSIGLSSPSGAALKSAGHAVQTDRPDRQGVL